MNGPSNRWTTGYAGHFDSATAVATGASCTLNQVVSLPRPERKEEEKKRNGMQK
jgi:hypothetical protein